VRIRHEWTLVLAAALLAAVSGAAIAQEAAQPRPDAAQPNPLLNRRGWEAGGQIASYRYEEPNFMKLSGGRIGGVGAYTFAFENRAFVRIDMRASYGLLEYESVSTGTQDDVPDFITEARVVVGWDWLAGESTALSPYVGLGYRYLYNDLSGYSSTGAVGYERISQYLYVPLGITLRFRATERLVIAPTLEYDLFLRGWQDSYLSDTGLGYSDAENKQSDGYGYRAYLMFETRRWALGPYMHYWKIKASDVVQIAPNTYAYEPENWTREYGLEFRYRF
jgi:opacity protein-like surface antigen